MEFSKTGGVSGAWAKANEIKSGTPVKLITEATISEGEYGSQTVAKARFKGGTEAINLRINKPTINGLIDAFGKDSKDWIGKVMTAQTEKAIVGGKRVTILYLIPEGFELREDDGGYMIIARKEKNTKSFKEPESEYGGEEPSEDWFPSEQNDPELKG